MFKKLILIAFATFAVGSVAFAQQMAPPGGQMAPPPAAPGIKRTVMQKFDVPAGERETVSALVELPPSTDAAKHTHPGPETGYIVEGEITLNVDGQPPKLLKVGDSYYVPAGTPHSGRSGASGVKFIGVYIVEKGKPLASPAP
jgi:quercetin dioxygenase-like cupin family protein